MGRANFAEADVLIDGGTIAEVGPGLRARDAEVVDATDTIVMPGFVDTHRHVWRSLFRNLDERSSDLRDLFAAEDVYAATLIGLLGAAEAGITTVVDWSDAHADGRAAEAALEAHVDSGMRTVLVVPDKGAFSRLGKEAGTGDTTVALGARLPKLAESVDLARQHGARIHAHAGVDGGGSGEVAAVADLLGPDVTLVHCTNLDDHSLDAIAAAGAAVVLTPSSEMASGLGPPPIQRIVDRKIRPGLGIDDERSAPGDLFAQMRATISLQHATYFDLKLAGKAGLPNLLTTREVIRFATIDGARAAGIGDSVGVLAPGRQADIVLLRTDRPNIFPVNDPIGAVVWGMDTSNVDWVFVGGKALKSNGELQGDLQRAQELAVAAQQRVASSSGSFAGVASGGVG
jgi:cytosine/adenosine deaminase-related metal-dependent hydrolase